MCSNMYVCVRVCQHEVEVELRIVRRHDLTWSTAGWILKYYVTQKLYTDKF